MHLLVVAAVHLLVVAAVHLLVVAAVHLLVVMVALAVATAEEGDAVAEEGGVEAEEGGVEEVEISTCIKYIAGTLNHTNYLYISSSYYI